MIRSLLRRFGSLFVAIVAVSVLTLPVSAATSSTATTGGNGLKVSPVTTNLVINKGEMRTVTIYVQNVTDAPATLQAVVNDFVASSDESGKPALILDPGQYAPSHSLKRYVAPIDNFTLQPGEQRGVRVSITIPKSAVAGGYFGAVRFAPAAVSSSNNVTLSASIGSLILVKVPGSFTEDLRLLSIDARTSADDNPQVLFFGNSKVVATVRFQNRGDVQEQPFGKIQLKQGSKQLALYEVNDTTPRGNVLPDSIRKFTVNLDKVGAFGQYTIVGNFGYGANGQLLTGQTTFYVIPLTAIIVGLVVLALALFGIFGLPRVIRRYNESVIRRASRR